MAIFKSSKAFSKDWLGKPCIKSKLKLVTPLSVASFAAVWA